LRIRTRARFSEGEGSQFAALCQGWEEFLTESVTRVALDETDPEEIVIDRKGREGQIYGGQLLHHTHGIPMSEAGATGVHWYLQTQHSLIAEVEHDMGWNAAALVNHTRIDAITRITAKPVNQLVGTLRAARSLYRDFDVASRVSARFKGRSHAKYSQDRV
jgi:hypothetical protein